MATNGTTSSNTFGTVGESVSQTVGHSFSTNMGPLENLFLKLLDTLASPRADKSRFVLAGSVVSYY
jgi:hypothetical protein